MRRGNVSLKSLIPVSSTVLGGSSPKPTRAASQKVTFSMQFSMHRVPFVPPTSMLHQPPKPVGVREMCLEGNNAWASAAADWLECREAAKRHASAAASLKGLVESDVPRAFGHGVEIRRSKAGALSIKEIAA